MFSHSPVKVTECLLSSSFEHLTRTDFLVQLKQIWRLILTNYLKNSEIYSNQKTVNLVSPNWVKIKQKTLQMLPGWANIKQKPCNWDKTFSHNFPQPQNFGKYLLVNVIAEKSSKKTTDDDV